MYVIQPVSAGVSYYSAETDEATTAAYTAEVWQIVDGSVDKTMTVDTGDTARPMDFKSLPNQGTWRRVGFRPLVAVNVVKGMNFVRG